MDVFKKKKKFLLLHTVVIFKVNALSRSITPKTDLLNMLVEKNPVSFYVCTVEFSLLISDSLSTAFSVLFNWFLAQQN